MAKPKALSTNDHLRIARAHLDRVQSSWDPPDWAILAAFGLYAIESAVMAASKYLKLHDTKTHYGKSDIAAELHTKHGLPEVESLMRDLNDARKSEAYGDIEFPSDLDPEEVATSVETYIDAVEELVSL